MITHEPTVKNEDSGCFGGTSDFWNKHSEENLDLLVFSMKHEVNTFSPQSDASKLET